MLYLKSNLGRLVFHSNTYGLGIGLPNGNFINLSKGKRTGTIETIGTIESAGDNSGNRMTLNVCISPIFCSLIVVMIVAFWNNQGCVAGETFDGGGSLPSSVSTIKSSPSSVPAKTLPPQTRLNILGNSLLRCSRVMKFALPSLKRLSFIKAAS